MLTDFPAAIVLSLVLYVSILWLKQKSNPGIYACIVGGTLAMATFIRYSALILLPIWMIIAFIKFKPRFFEGLKFPVIFWRDF